MHPHPGHKRVEGTAAEKRRAAWCAAFGKRMGGQMRASMRAVQPRDALSGAQGLAPVEVAKDDDEGI